ncbi:MAG: DUF5058 family protein [Paludibacteraceae bacterium]|nr:DUF5058 family protein [Paludibacteraceae bacterium]
MSETFTIIYVMGGIIAALIVAMSLFFIFKSVRRAKEIGMDMSVIKETVRNSAIFSIVPSIPIVIGIGIMMQYLGLGISWIRLEVIGALQYEIIAMNQVVTPGQVITYVTVATALVIMTLSILSGPVFNAIFYKRYQHRLAELQQKNEHLMNTLTGALLGGLFSGILSAMLVAGIFTIGTPVVAKDTGVATYGEVTLITFFASCLIMVGCGLCMKKFGWKWMESYALPITIVGALVAAYFAVACFE